MFYFEHFSIFILVGQEDSVYNISEDNLYEYKKERNSNGETRI